MGKDYPYYALWRLLEPELLSTQQAFQAYPTQARQRHFLRRTKEEMVDLHGQAIYPTRISDTHSYDLTQGEASEQDLYDRTTAYIREVYNKAELLNRSAARLAMLVFQRRLASSTYALARSLERRLGFLEALADDLRTGRLTDAEMRTRVRALKPRDPLADKTADEESCDDREENEKAQEDALRAHAAANLAEVEAEVLVVRDLLALAGRVQDRGDESKFVKLQAALEHPDFRAEKVLIFTEHRDTLDFLVRRLEGMGFTGQVARIHGGMDYRERDEEVAFFRKEREEGGAQYMVATDAAGEGINLQFCGLMVNYDIPWNPARLEQRMGRIHRYGQKRDPVVIVNLVAGKTREGEVLRTLLDKLETIRKELGGKVFDVIGRLFEGLALSDYMVDVLAGRSADVLRKLQSLTKEEVQRLTAAEQKAYGDPEPVRSAWREQEEAYQREQWRRQLPGYVRRFVQRAAPNLGLRIEGDLDGTFRLLPTNNQGRAEAARRPTGAPPAWLAGWYDRELTVNRPDHANGRVFLYPGEPLFDRLRDHVCQRYGPEARRGGVFVDPEAERPYLFHLAAVAVIRRGDPDLPALAREEARERWLVGLRQAEGEPLEECPLEPLLGWRAAEGVPLRVRALAESAAASRREARDHLEQQVMAPRVQKRRGDLLVTLQERSDFLRRGYEYQKVELLAARQKLRERVEAGDRSAQARWEAVKARQRSLDQRRDAALAVLRREPELLAPGTIEFLAHALVLPGALVGAPPREDPDVEAIAVRVAMEYERRRGATVQDVSTPPKARAAGLADNPGFDVLATHPGGERWAIEIKGRRGKGEVELTANEWVQACNHRERYWLYAVFGCGGPAPQLLRIQDPFGKLLARRSSVVLAATDLLAAAEQ
jgi:superfamily II DNA/RNA helicase